MANDKVSTRPLIDKLGVKPMSKVSVLGSDDEYFWEQLQARTPDVSRRLRNDSDVIFYAADSEVALKKLKSLQDHLRKDGAIWVVSLKGKQAKIRDVQVIAAAKAAGLVDNKVVAFSETHTALRLVIRVALR
ncbi:MAG TPA: DUF3052 family protein [Anaerolineales bacterium]|nr:DUF3052 family protein [Anaerolineales bacterium]